MINDNLLKYFIEHTDKRFDEIKSKIIAVEEKIDGLNKFKWKLTGFATAVVFLIEIGRFLLENKIRS